MAYSEMAVVCALCKVPKERYRLREGMQKGGGPAELYRQLKPVVDDLATCKTVFRGRVCVLPRQHTQSRETERAL